jgi:hypothetical protein
MQLDSDSFCDRIQIWRGIVGHLGAEIDFLTLENGDCPPLFWRGASLATPTRSRGGSFERGAQKEQISSLQLFDQIPRSWAIGP